MKQYTLKLNSGVNYNLYDGTTLVTDATITDLFASAGSAYFSFDFDGGTPSATNTAQLVDSNNTVIMTATTTVAEGKNYKGTWGDSASTFTSFDQLSGKSMDESQLSFLMGEIKDTEAELADVAYVSDIIGTPTNIAYVATINIQDGAVTFAKTDSLVLWEDTDDGSSAIQLSETSANFKYIEVFFHDDQGFQNSTKIYNNKSTSAVAFCLQALKTGGSGDVVYLSSRRMTLNGSTLTHGHETATTIRTNVNPTLVSSNILRITKIIGHRS